MPDDLLTRLRMAHVRPGSLPSVPADLPPLPRAGTPTPINLARGRAPTNPTPPPAFAPTSPSRGNVGFARPLPLADAPPTRLGPPGPAPAARPTFVAPMRPPGRAVVGPAVRPTDRQQLNFRLREDPANSRALSPTATGEPHPLGPGPAEAPMSAVERHFLANMTPYEPPEPAAAARLQPAPAQAVIPRVTSDPALAHVAKQTAYGLHLDAPAAVADAARVTIPPPGPSASSLELAAMDQAFSPHGVGLPGGAGPMLRGMAGRVGSGLGQAALVNEVGGHIANSLAEAFYPTSGHPGLGASLDGSPRFLGLGPQADANERNFNEMVKAEGLANRRPLPTIAGAMGWDAGGGEVGNARYHGPDVNVPDTLAGHVSGWLGGPRVGTPLNRYRDPEDQLHPSLAGMLGLGPAPAANPAEAGAPYAPPAPIPFDQIPGPFGRPRPARPGLLPR